MGLNKNLSCETMLQLTCWKGVKLSEAWRVKSWRSALLNSSHDLTHQASVVHPCLVLPSSRASSQSPMHTSSTSQHGHSPATIHTTCREIGRLSLLWRSQACQHVQTQPCSPPARDSHTPTFRSHAPPLTYASSSLAHVSMHLTKIWLN